MGQIHVLDKSVAERIAAGEVVERPASVVKELIENSLDAGATQVVIEIDRAGSELVRVSDNGAGMDVGDLRLSVRRFATSKVASADDLLGIRSFGFRGEALPSIAAVAHLEITSATEGSAEAHRLRLVGGDVVKDEITGAPVGTTVAVRQLFFNTPARRKFLKSPAREFGLIVDTINRLALAHPHVAFRLVHEGDEVLRFPAGKAEERVAAVLGGDSLERAVPLHDVREHISISGWLGRPELARATRGHQYLFVNRRPVASRMLAGATEQAYRELVPAGRFPVFALFIDLPPYRVDVNIHPRKLEVRFDDDHQIFGAVARAARAALREASLVRAVDAPAAVLPGAATPVPLGLPEGEFAPLSQPAEVSSAGRLPPMRLLGQLHATYLLAQGPDGLIVIDQHAAHERVLYERLLDARRRQDDPGQVLVTPVSVALEAGESRLLAEHLDVLTDLGFVLEPFGDRTVLIRALPDIARSVPPHRLLQELLAELADGNRPRAAYSALEQAAIATACHTAIRAGDRLTTEQMVALLQDLARTADPFTCFHGRPTLVTVPLSHLERWFLRT